MVVVLILVRDLDLSRVEDLSRFRDDRSSGRRDIVKCSHHAGAVDDVCDEVCELEQSAALLKAANLDNGQVTCGRP